MSLDLTHQVLASSEAQSRILHGSTDSSAPPTTLRRILHALLNFFGTTYETVFGLTTGPPLHDPLAVAVLLSNLNPTFAEKNPSALKFDDRNGERFNVTVITDGLHGHDASITGQLGRTVVSPADGAGVAIPRGVDVDKFWGIVLDCIQLADECNAARGA